MWYRALDNTSNGLAELLSCAVRIINPEVSSDLGQSIPGPSGNGSGH